MAGNKKPRKKYEPDRQMRGLSSCSKAAANAPRFSTTDQLHRISRTRTAFDAVLSGKGDMLTWGGVMSAFNVIKVLAGIPDVFEGQAFAFCREAEKTLVEATQRWAKTLNGVLTEYETEVLSALFVLYEDALANVPKRIFEGAEMRVLKRIDTNTGLVRVRGPK